MPGTRKLGRATDSRNAMLRAMVTYLFAVSYTHLTKYVTIKVSDLEKFEAGATVDTEALLKAGIISKTLDGVKVLGNGELTKALNVKVAAYTLSLIHI